MTSSCFICPSGNRYKAEAALNRAAFCVEIFMKDWAASFYKSKAWQSCRAAYIDQHPLCEDCLAKGIYTPAEIVHHIVELTPDNITDPTITTSFDNLRAVCRECHAEEHGFKVRRYQLDELGRVAAR